MANLTRLVELGGPNGMMTALGRRMMDPSSPGGRVGQVGMGVMTGNPAGIAQGLSKGASPMDRAVAMQRRLGAVSGAPAEAAPQMGQEEALKRRMNQPYMMP